MNFPRPVSILITASWGQIMPDGRWGFPAQNARSGPRISVRIADQAAAPA